MGHYQTVRFEADLNDRGVQVLDELTLMNGDWPAVAAVYFQWEDRLLRIGDMLADIKGLFDIQLARVTPRHLSYNHEYKWRGERQDVQHVIESILPFFIATPTTVWSLHELWDNPRVKLVQPEKIEEER